MKYPWVGMGGTFACLVFALLQSCGNSKEQVDDADKPFRRGVSIGVLDNHEINEASGLAASRVNPGLLWTHNDSGDQARIFLIDSLGRYQMTVFLEGVENRDWEDIAVGPGPEDGKSYVYIGDIGDNFGRHTYKYIYRIEEPVRTTDSLVIREIDSIKFTLPDGSRDSEALMIDPLTRDLYLFSKREKAVNLYRLPYPQSTSGNVVAELVYEGLPMTRVVAADWSADGSEILVKTYKKVYYVSGKKEPLKKFAESEVLQLPYDQEPQGESIAFCIDGRGYYTLSEKKNGRTPQLIFYRRVQQEGAGIGDVQ